MKTVLIIIIGIIALGVIFLGDKIFGTAEAVADKTVFNSDKIIYTYEQFHEKYQQYEQYGKQLAQAEERMVVLKKEGIRSGQEYDNLSNEITGIRQMRNRIASEYNAMSKIKWEKIWKEKGLPETLE